MIGALAFAFILISSLVGMSRAQITNTASGKISGNFITCELQAPAKAMSELSNVNGPQSVICKLKNIPNYPLRASLNHSSHFDIAPKDGLYFDSYNEPKIIHFLPKSDTDNVGNASAIIQAARISFMFHFDAREMISDRIDTIRVNSEWIKSGTCKMTTHSEINDDFSGLRLVDLMSRKRYLPLINGPKVLLQSEHGVKIIGDFKRCEKDADGNSDMHESFACLGAVSVQYGSSAIVLNAAVTNERNRIHIYRVGNCLNGHMAVKFQKSNNTYTIQLDDGSVIALEHHHTTSPSSTHFASIDIKMQARHIAKVNGVCGTWFSDKHPSQAHHHHVHDDTTIIANHSPFHGHLDPAIHSANFYALDRTSMTTEFTQCFPHLPVANTDTNNHTEL